MAQNVEKVHRHVSALTDGVSYETNCTESRHVPAIVHGVSYDTKCRERRYRRSRTNCWCFL